MNSTSIKAAGTAGLPEILQNIVSLFPIDDYTSETILGPDDLGAITNATAYLLTQGVQIIGYPGASIDGQHPVRIVPTRVPLLGEQF